MNEPMSYEEYLQLLQLGGDNADLANAIAQQQQQAEWLRMNAPEMRGNGRVQTAPGFMELLGGLARNKSSFDLQKTVREQQQRQQQQSTHQNQLIMQAILRGQTPQMPKQMDTQDYGGGL